LYETSQGLLCSNMHYSWLPCVNGISIDVCGMGDAAVLRVGGFPVRFSNAASGKIIVPHLTWVQGQS